MDLGGSDSYKIDDIVGRGQTQDPPGREKRLPSRVSFLEMFG